MRGDVRKRREQGAGRAPQTALTHTLTHETMCMRVCVCERRYLSRFGYLKRPLGRGIFDGPTHDAGEGMHLSFSGGKYVSLGGNTFLWGEIRFSCMK